MNYKYILTLSVTIFSPSALWPMDHAGPSEPPRPSAMTEIITFLTKFEECQNIPLHLAAVFGNIEIVKQLIEKGHRLNVKNSNGKTALALAKKYDQKLTSQFLWLTAVELAKLNKHLAEYRFPPESDTITSGDKIPIPSSSSTVGKKRAPSCSSHLEAKISKKRFSRVLSISIPDCLETPHTPNTTKQEN